MENFSSFFYAAQEKRKALVARLETEKTDAYRLFHGVAEGLPGLTIDRYGPLLLVQTFRDPLTPSDLAHVEESLRKHLSHSFDFAYNHRGKGATTDAKDSLLEVKCREFGVEFLIRARHRGLDPWLFLDMRVGRRFLRSSVSNSSLINLFSYTCSVGVTAAAAGASEVWNVDFAGSNLEVGERNAKLNGIESARFRTIQEDCLPVMRQLAGLPAGGRFDKTRKLLHFDARTFDWVFLDPPAWAKGPYGAVDVVNDYQSLFKSAVLMAKAGGGRVVATNHVASVDLKSWTDLLKRCADKAGKPIRNLESLTPEEDFPSFDGKHPLKIVVCEF